MGKIQSNKKIIPFLWFDGKAEDAARFYTGIFSNSEILKIRYYGEGGPVPKGSVMGVDFVLEDQLFYSLNGGPAFKFTPAISLFVHCDSQAEIDRLWKALSAGGHEQQCGWLTDQFGLSWQIIPKQLGELLQDPDAERSRKAMQAMLKMKKIIIAELEEATK